MTSLREWLGRLWTLFSRRRLAGQIEEEIAEHIALAAADFERSGLGAAEARRAALRAFGNVAQTKERYRDISGFPWADALAQDLRYGVRMARRQPGFSAIVVISIGLGVGANTAIFSLVNTVLLRPLAYPEPERLVVVRVVLPAMVAEYPSLPVNVPAYLRWQIEVPAFAQLAAIAPEEQTLTGMGDAQRLAVARVSPSLFPMLGVTTQLGRPFVASDDRSGHGAVVVLSDDYWRSRFGGERSAIGRTIVLDGQPCEIIGVLPAGFRFPRSAQLGALITLPDRIDVFRPTAFTANEQTSFGDFGLAVIGRLRRGATREQALEQLNRVQADLARTVAQGRVELAAAVIPLQEQMVGGARRGLQLLWLSVGAVLLVLCVNLANLLLARIGERGRETAVRLALGASRARLLRQFVIEHLLLAAAGGILGLAVATVLLQALAAGAPIEVPRLDELRVDGRVLGFGLLVTGLCGLLFSIVPAWRLSRQPPQEALRASQGVSPDSPAQMRTRTTLVALEVALSTVLLVVAGLLVTSFVRLVGVDRGFSVERILIAEVQPSPARVPDKAARAAYYDRLLMRVRTLPGVDRVGLVSHLPLQGEAQVNTITVEHDTRPIAELPTANFRFVNAAYFEVVGMTLRQGRLFDESDRGRHVVVINERTAAALWRGQTPLGRRLHIGDAETPLHEVVGVVADTREVDLTRPPILMGYAPYWGNRVPDRAALLLATGIEPTAMAPLLRHAIAEVDPTVPVENVKTLMQVVDKALAPSRFQMMLVAVFAAAALLLASLGIYGVPAYMVARRRQELGIRLALGAPPRALVWMVVRQGLVPVFAGLALGFSGALAAGRLMATLLFDVSPSDPATLGLVLAVLGSVAMAACYIPARRATRIDPVTSLRLD